MYTEGTTRQVLYRFSQPAVELFHSLGKLKVDLSPSKSGFVATTRGTALTVCSGWQEKGFCISSIRYARDMGVDVSFGSRSVPIAWTRAKRALVRARRTRALPRNMLVPVASCSKESTCGHQIWGIPLTSMKRLRAAAAWTSGYRAEMCTTTLLAITKTEPASRLHAEVITKHLVFLRDNPLQSKRIERAWQLLLRRFEKTSRKRQGKGGMCLLCRNVRLRAFRCVEIVFSKSVFLIFSSHRQSSTGSVAVQHPFPH